MSTRRRTSISLGALSIFRQAHRLEAGQQVTHRVAGWSAETIQHLIAYFSVAPYVCVYEDDELTVLRLEEKRASVG